jgi:hypothetical protein
MGGLPLEQERANPHKRIQIRRKTALFNPVINVLMAQIVLQAYEGATNIRKATVVR